MNFLNIRNYNLIIIATLYCHPFEFIIGNFFPLFSGLLLFKSRIHAITLSTWSMYRLIFTFEEHTGYDFPWHLNKAVPFNVTSDHHSYHHLKNIGNYSQFTQFWDRVFGTDHSYFEFKKQIREKTD